jgi:hypothetical protein
LMQVSLEERSRPKELLGLLGRGGTPQIREVGH